MAEVEKKTENLVYAKPKLITDNVMHYCPGCSHGTVHKLIAEVVEEMGLAEKTVGVSPVGCSVFAYNYIDIDWIEAAHGRALAVATAVKRLWPQNLVFSYLGDGDLSAIGTAYITRQSVHTAAIVRKCKKAIRKAFENSMAGNGFSLVEVVSTCNSGWKLSPVASNDWLAENMLPFYPLGDIKDVT